METSNGFKALDTFIISLGVSQIIKPVGLNWSSKFQENNVRKNTLVDFRCIIKVFRPDVFYYLSDITSF